MLPPSGRFPLICLDQQKVLQTDSVRPYAIASADAADPEGDQATPERLPEIVSRRTAVVQDIHPSAGWIATRRSRCTELEVRAMWLHGRKQTRSSMLEVPGATGSSTIHQTQYDGPKREARASDCSTPTDLPELAGWRINRTGGEIPVSRVGVRCLLADLPGRAGDRSTQIRMQTRRAPPEPVLHRRFERMNTGLHVCG